MNNDFYLDDEDYLPCLWCGSNQEPTTTLLDIGSRPVGDFGEGQDGPIVQEFCYYLVCANPQCRRHIALPKLPKSKKIQYWNDANDRQRFIELYKDFLKLANSHQIAMHWEKALLVLMRGQYLNRTKYM
jgi:hypothetical protein